MHTLAVIADLAADYGRDREFTQHAAQQLLGARTEKDEQVWWTTDETSAYRTGASAAVETTELAVQALLRSGEILRRGAKGSYLSSKKKRQWSMGHHAGDDHGIARCSNSDREGSSGRARTATVLLNGKPAETLVLSSENNDLYHQFVFNGIDQGKTYTVEIRF